MTRALRHEPIAVIGRGCRLPGANNLQAFWDLILSGKCVQQKIPEARLDRKLFFDPEKGVRGKSYSDIACLVDPVDFQAPLNRLPWSLKSSPESTYSTLAHVAMETVDDSGWDPLDLPIDNLGVFIGHTRSSGYSGNIAFANYSPLIASQLERLPRELFPCDIGVMRDRLIDGIVRDYPLTSQVPLGASFAAKAVSDAIHATGPYMSFNGACASSTHALLQAVRSLQSGRIELAIAGGASYCHADTLILFSQAQSLSASGTRPWDAAADGLVVGEGCVTLLLCRLEDAIRWQRPIYGIIRGIGLSTDGKGKSLWAPRKEGQVLAIQRAYGNGVTKEAIGYIEAHATSTQVGDATEIAALSESYHECGSRQRIPIGSVKANIGHTLETAGIAGVLKCLLAMEAEMIPPVKHVVQPNPKISWDKIPLELPSEPRRWNPGAEGWMAGVNAFGIGGLNTHVVISKPRSTATIKSVQNSPSRRKESNLCEIAITGMGCVLPGVSGEQHVEAFWNRIAKGIHAFTNLTENRWRSSAYCSQNRSTSVDIGKTFAIRSRLAGIVQDYRYDWRKHKVPPKQIEQASPLQFMILDAVDSALKDAGLMDRSGWQERTGVIVGTAFGGEFSNQLQMGLRIPEIRLRLQSIFDQFESDDVKAKKLLDEFEAGLLAEMPALLDETGSFTSSSLASRVTKSLNLLGGAVAVDSGTASMGAALLCAVDQLIGGDVDRVICIGAHQDLGPSRFLGMTRSGVLGSAEWDRDSFPKASYPGEGCIVLVLQRHEDALKEHSPVHAILQQIATGYASGNPVATQFLTRSRHSKATPPDEPLNSNSVYFRFPERLVGDLSGASLGVRLLASVSPNHKGKEDCVCTYGEYENCYQILLKRS